MSKKLRSVQKCHGSTTQLETKSFWGRPGFETAYCHLHKSPLATHCERGGGGGYNNGNFHTLRGERHPGRGESLSTGVVTLLLTAGIVRQLAAGRRCRFKGSTWTNKARLKTYEVPLAKIWNSGGYEIYSMKTRTRLNTDTTRSIVYL